MTERREPALTAIVLTYNEEKNLEACLAPLAECAAEIVVVDSGSNDGTLEIAKRLGARIVAHPFETHARQWNWALDNTAREADWILALDADQRLTRELAEEIRRRLADGAPGYDGFYLCRRQVFRGRWIRHGGYYPKHLLKLFRRGRGRADERDLVDHHFVVEGRVGLLRHDLVEDNRNEWNLDDWIAKHVRYAALQAEQEAGDAERWKESARWRGTPDERVAWMKTLWGRLPLYVRPFLYFVYRYVFRLGFLDGREGFLFHFLQAWWYRLLVDVRLEEIRRARGDISP